MADVLYGEHADEHSVLGDGQRSEAALLQDAKTFLEEELWAS